ncbi:LysR family transcriptional regulator [Sinorhizobium meliloti]|uniref:LysR family transcriptional regulator n=2 Tax=Rhizobium meliloti TaxID=382 RepID=UPI001F18B8AF|nr:LysR family transcriptional regulator [Sinorhizobium meliloti]
MLMQDLMLKIDPKKLLYLATIIEHGSLKRAARSLNATQPALSSSLSRLESELGIRPFERTPKGVIPTDLGEILHCHARLIRDEIGLSERALQRMGRSPSRCPAGEPTEPGDGSHASRAAKMGTSSS